MIETALSVGNGGQLEAARMFLPDCEPPGYSIDPGPNGLNRTLYNESTSAYESFYEGFLLPIPPGSTVISAILRLYEFQQAFVAPSVGEWWLYAPYDDTDVVDTTTPYTVFAFLDDAPEQNGQEITTGGNETFVSIDVTAQVQAFIDAANYAQNRPIIFHGVTELSASFNEFRGAAAPTVERRPVLMVEYESNGLGGHLQPAHLGLGLGLVMRPFRPVFRR